ncbi:MAG: ATP-binding protein [Bacteroidales bacterium]
MDKSVIKKIIIRKQEEILTTELIKRDIELESGCNYVFVGLRRAGKSFLMFQHILSLIDSGKNVISDILYINFEDERISMMKAYELGDIIESYEELFDKKPIVFLDEIQNIDGWEKFARRLADSKYQVYVTGSNAKMLSRDISTTLGGRYIVKEIYPFSFLEYLQINGIVLSKNWEFTSVKNSVVKLWENYFRYGGFAESFDLKDKRSWLNSLYQKILLGDIVARNSIRNPEAIRLLGRKLAESIMQPTSQSRLQNIVSSSGVKVSRSTIVEYIGYMKDAYLIFGVSNYTDNINERESSQKRYYHDNGLLTIFLTDSDTKLLENIVAITLIKRYHSDNIFYYKKNVEVDFYIPSEGIAIQSSYSIVDDATFERETKALVKLNSAFDTKRSIIITYNEEREIDVDGLKIEVIPIWKWLVNNL